MRPHPFESNPRPAGGRQTVGLLLVGVISILLGVGAVRIAAEVSTLEPRYVAAFVGGIVVLLLCLTLKDRQRLFYLFLALFVLGIPFNLDLKLFYRKFHLGGAMGIDVSLSLICAVVLFSIMLYERYLAPEQRRFRYQKALLGTQLLFMLAGFMSLLNADDPVLVFYELVKLAVLFFFSLLTMNLRDEKQLRTILFFLSLGVFIQGVFAVYQYKTGHSLGLKVFGEQPMVTQYLGYTASRATGTIGHPNLLAYYFEILLPLLLALYLVEESRLARLWYFLVLVVGLVGMVTTLSRAGWMTLPLSFFAVFVILVKERWYRWRTVFEVLFGVACLVAFFYFFLPTIEKRYFYEDYGSASTRIPLNRAAMSIISQFPVFGVGLNNLAEVFRRYDTTGGATMIAGPSPHVVHNLYLSVWADVGTVGFAAFVLFLLSILIVAWRQLSRVSGWQHGILIGIMAGLLAHLFHGFVDPGFKSALNISYLIYVLIGVIGAVALMRPSEAATENPAGACSQPASLPAFPFRLPAGSSGSR